MKLTDKHVSEDWINQAIRDYAVMVHRIGFDYQKRILDALIELKQRRAEDRAREVKTSCQE